jgi:Mrp family chromosome partitioning ATPase
MKTNETYGIDMTAKAAMPSLETTPYMEERRELDAPEVPLPKPQRMAEERYRLVATRLEALLDQRHTTDRGTRPLGRVVIVTSPQRGDGKTTTALHLGTALSRGLGRRVAVIDADLARPGLAPMLGLGSSRGVSDVLAGSAGLDDVLLRGEDGGPLLVPAGGPETNGHRRGLASIVNSLREYNDLVLVDTPALCDAADAAILGRGADGVILVVRAGATREDTLVSALDALVDAPLLGCVLNDHDGRAEPRRSARPTVWEEDE